MNLHYTICLLMAGSLYEELVGIFVVSASIWHLDQTINSKNRLEDINSAVNRWLVTSSMRAQIANQLLDIADMSPNTDTKSKKNLRSTE